MTLVVGVVLREEHVVNTPPSVEVAVDKNRDNSIKFQSENDSKNYRKFLMLGGAFDGRTPGFILNHMVKKLPDLDSELNALFSENNTIVRM